MPNNYDGSIVAIGDAKIRENIYKVLNKPISIIHPSAIIVSSTFIGAGCVIEANAILNSNVVVKEGSFICSGAVVNHNSVVGKFCQIDCNAVVTAGMSVPDCTKVESCVAYRNFCD